MSYAIPSGNAGTNSENNPWSATQVNGSRSVMRQVGDSKNSGLRESITLDQIEAPETHTFRGLIQL